MTKHLIFLIEDDDSIRRLLQQKLEKSWGHTVRLFGDTESALAALEEFPALVVIDMTRPAINVAGMFKELRLRSINLPIIALLNEADPSAVSQALKLGVVDYIELPIDMARAENVFRQTFKNIELNGEIFRLREEIAGTLADKNIVAESREMQLVLRLMEKVKDREIPILLTGEPGSGREMVAKSIHTRGKRRSRPYITFTQSSVPADLLCGELFGFEKGAFPGATQGKAGVFEQAEGGTVYLDEIGDFDTDLQTRLLHLIEFKQVTALGAETPTKVDVRIIAGSSRNLKDLVRTKQFRSDLYYHLASFPIHVPPLRERAVDIILLAEQFLVEYGKEAGVKVKGFSREALEAIYHYPWPGNVRELDSAVRRAISLAQGDLIGLHHLPIVVHSFKDASMELETEGKLFHDNKIVPLDKIKEQAVRRAIEIARGNLAQTARELDISRSTLYKLIEKYKIPL
ncbi:MAG: sigma-54-dependent Fis family transcriptional regulator [Bacteroidetes bacterium]|nr:sigma-54-dependent Fis family transcriptional regulator [Bacteroidota bacterium]